MITAFVIAYILLIGAWIGLFSLAGDLIKLFAAVKELKESLQADGYELAEFRTQLRSLRSNLDGNATRINERLEEHHGKLEVLKDAALGHLNAHIRDINERDAKPPKKKAATRKRAPHGIRISA